jgi:hypothetical protein
MFIIVASAWLVCGLIGWLIGHFKKRAAAGLAMGLLLGPIGCILLLLDAPLWPAIVFAVAVLGISAVKIRNGFIDEAELVRLAQERKEQQMVELGDKIDKINKDLKEKNQQSAREWARIKFEALPKWDEKGNPINRVPPPELTEATPPPSVNMGPGTQPP